LPSPLAGDTPGSRSMENIVSQDSAYRKKLIRSKALRRMATFSFSLIKNTNIWLLIFFSLWINITPMV
jgi:hypothetical protein